jgi:small nuclear ribonucleoprotein
MSASKVENPFKTLKMAMNKNVLVKVKDGYEYVGRLVMVDLTMNVVLSECTEFSDGGRSPIAKYGTVFIRGSQILYVAIDYNPKI